MPSPGNNLPTPSVAQWKGSISNRRPLECTLFHPIYLPLVLLIFVSLLPFATSSLVKTASSVSTSRRARACPVLCNRSEVLCYNLLQFSHVALEAGASCFFLLQANR